MTVWIAIGLLGWVCGVVVNYLADVLPWKRTLAVPFCLQCQKEFPGLKYALWPRRCPSCGKARSWRVWVVEVAFIGIALWLWQARPLPLGFWAGLLVMVYFAVVVVIDMEYRLILHPVSVFGAVLGLGVGTWLHGLWTTLLGGAVGFGVMWLLYALGELLVRFMAKRRGMATDEVALGFGDVNLSGVLGLLLGWQLIGVGLLIGVLVGGAISLVYLLAMIVLRRYHLFLALPYGPFLVLGGILVLYFPSWLLGALP